MFAAHSPGHEPKLDESPLGGSLASTQTLLPHIDTGLLGTCFDLQVFMFLHLFPRGPVDTCAPPLVPSPCRTGSALLASRNDDGLPRASGQ